MKFKCFLRDRAEESYEVEINDMAYLKKIAEVNGKADVHIDFERMCVIIIPNTYERGAKFTER